MLKLARSLDSQKILQTMSLLFVGLFLVVGILTMPEYGLTWDEALGNLFFGQRYFYYFTTFNQDYLDFSRSDLWIHDRPLNLSLSVFHLGAQEFPPFS